MHPALFCLLIACFGLINPKFTPIHLVGDSDTILEIEATAAQEETLLFNVKTVIKGKFADKTLSLSLKNTGLREQAVVVRKLCAAQLGKPVLLFIGAISAPAGGGQGADGADPGGVKGFLHIDGSWIAFDQDKTGWEMREISSTMLQTWNGATDMLRKEVDYILTDPDATVPCDEGATWLTPEKIATVAGKVGMATPIVLADGGHQLLYLAADSGDRLFQYDAAAKATTEVTAQHKLAAKSLIATWGDLEAASRMDLVSWDGEAVTIFRQDQAGCFAAVASLPKAQIAGGCTALAVVGAAAPGRPVVLIGTAAMPRLWIPGKAGEEQVTKPLAAGEAPVAGLGAAGRCLVADFDGDGIADVLQLFVKGSLVYKGMGNGQFEAAKPCAVALGTGPSDAFVGDFDSDGLLDIFTLGDNTRLWSGHGGFIYEDLMRFTGEPSYKGQIDSHAGATGDINGDGRQDVIFFYHSTPPSLNFNRGFRSFGHANSLDFSSTNGTPGIIPGSENGQQTGAWCDLDGNGVPEFAIVLTNGEVWHLPVECGADKVGGVRVALSAKSSLGAGPVLVTGYRGKRCLGAWNVTTGMEAFIAQIEAGPVTITWKTPDGKEHRKEVVVENAPVTFVLP